MTARVLRPVLLMFALLLIPAAGAAADRITLEIEDACHCGHQR
jgi:hypothetical protein